MKLKRAAPSKTEQPSPKKMSGSDLLSQGVAPQVPSALTGLTSVFGMGTGGSLSLTPPDKSIVLGNPEHSIVSTTIGEFLRTK